MSNIRIELNSDGVRELLRSAEMLAICEEHASQIARRCGSGYSHSGYTGKGRVNASVYAETDAAVKDNLKNNTVLRNLR